jgi:hypothetical protein
VPVPQHYVCGFSCLGFASAPRSLRASLDIRLAGWPPTPTTGVLQIEYLHSNGRSYRTDSDVTIEDDVLRCYTFRRSLAEEPRSPTK